MANYSKLPSATSSKNTYVPYVPTTHKIMEQADNSGYYTARNNYLADNYKGLTPVTTYTKMNPIFNSNGKNYDTYKGSDGNYYYYADGRYVRANDNVAKIIAKNKKVSFIDPDAKKTTTQGPPKSTATNTKTGTGGAGGTGGSGGTGSGKSNADDYETLLNEYKQKLDELLNPKVWTADELAKHLGVEDLYNYDRILQMYNDATDKYYTDALAEQNKINKNAEISNASYANRLLSNYINSYKNAAPTAVGKGTLAANALNSLLGADQANEEAASNLNDILNSYKEKWDYERANNEVLAREKYNDMGTWLLNQGTNINTADVQNYINALNAYDTAYSGIRNAQNNLASTAAATYQNNAQAALARNQLAASQASGDFLRKAYQLYYGTENNADTKAYNNTKRDVSTVYSQSSSAN